jgi:hypothetical protein
LSLEEEFEEWQFFCFEVFDDIPELIKAPFMMLRLKYVGLTPCKQYPQCASELRMMVWVSHKVLEKLHRKDQGNWDPAVGPGLKGGGVSGEGLSKLIVGYDG